MVQIEDKLRRIAFNAEDFGQHSLNFTADAVAAIEQARREMVYEIRKLKSYEDVMEFCDKVLEENEGW